MREKGEDVVANNLVLATHRGFASGIRSALSLILGNVDAVRTVEVDADSSMDSVCTQIGEALSKFPPDKPVFLVTDIPGGSPTQAVMKEATTFPNAVCITGLNLGMLLELATMPLDGSDIQDAKSMARDAVQSSVVSMGLLEDLAASADGMRSEDTESDEL